MIPSLHTLTNLTGSYTKSDLERAISSGNIKEIVEIAMILGTEIGRESVDIYDTEEYQALEEEIRGHKKEVDALEDRMHAAETDAFNKACKIKTLEEHIADYDKPDSEVVAEIKNELDFAQKEVERMEKICVDICWDTKFRNKFMKSARYAEIQAAQK